MNNRHHWRVFGAKSAGVLSIAALAFVGMGVHAAPAGTITEYPTVNGGEPEGIALGPDGNLWFTRGDDGRVGKITPAGTITTFILPSVGKGTGTGIGLHDMTAGPDGNMWFTEQDNPNVQGIGKVTMAGVATEYPLPNASEPWGITAGSDGKIWFTDGNTNQVSHINTDGTGIVDIPTTSTAKQIITGPDGKIWFAEDGNGKIGRIDPAVGASSLAEFQAVPTGSDSLYAVAKGPDGNIWFTSGDGAFRGINSVGKMSLDGATVTRYSIPTLGAEPEGMVAGPDGNMWFAESDQDQVAKVTMSGQFTEYQLPDRIGGTPRPVSPSPGLRIDQRDIHELAVGADHNIWWTEGGVSAESVIDVQGAIGTFALPQPSPTPTVSPTGTAAPASIGLPKAGQATGGPADFRWLGLTLLALVVLPAAVIAGRRLRQGS